MVSIYKRFWWMLLLVIILPSGQLFQPQQNWAALQVASASQGSIEQSCPALVTNALDSASAYCSETAHNTLCYGAGLVSSLASGENAPVIFEDRLSPRDLTSVVSVDTALGSSIAQMGIALVGLSNGNSTSLLLMLMGNVELATAPGSHVFTALNFSLQTSPGDTTACSNDQPPSMLLAQSGNAAFTINGIPVTLAGLAAFHTTPDGGLEIALVDGQAALSESTLSGGTAISAVLAEDESTPNVYWSAPRKLSTEELNLLSHAGNILASSSNEQPQAGQTLECLSPTNWTVYFVPAGETLWRISRAENVSIEELRQANCMAEQDILRAGQKFYVPRELFPLATPTPLPSTLPVVPSNQQPDGNNTGSNNGDNQAPANQQPGGNNTSENKAEDSSQQDGEDPDTNLPGGEPGGSFRPNPNNSAPLSDVVAPRTDGSASRCIPGTFGCDSGNPREVTRCPPFMICATQSPPGRIAGG